MRRVLRALAWIGRGLGQVVPWWAWALVAFAAIGALADLTLAVAGVVGAVAVLVLLYVAVRHARGRGEFDWRDAERATAQWLREVGCRKVELTSAGADGGIDVLTDSWAVQVKHTERRVGRPAIQQIVGAAMAVDRRPALVSSSGFSKPAVEFADEHEVALVELDDHGRGQPVNATARHIGDRPRRLLRRR